MVLKKIFPLFLFALLVAIATACVDTTRFDVPVVGDGDATLHISVGYDYEEAELRSRGPAEYEGGDAGNLIRNIETLWMVVYNEQGDLVRRYRVIGEDGSHDPEVENVVNSDDSDNRLESEKGDGTTPGLGDSKTGRVEFDITLPSARYYIYAVANVDNFESLDISTREKLKNLTFRWDNSTTLNNSQMFGIFTLGEPNRNATDANHIVVPATAAKLHAWVRRLASKVTVAFDGSELYDNVQVYVTDIAIKDIPRQCKLGVSNRAGLLPDGTMAERSRLHDESFDNSVIPTGKTIKVQEINEAQKRILPANYYHICKMTHPYLGIGEDEKQEDSTIIDRYHTPEAHSLFFFENNQGIGKPKQQLKPGSSSEIWYPNPSDTVPGSGWKDNLVYGTYVEVTGHYRCTANNAHVSAGTIKYRFMLGQNEDTDYNATRNTHYKLTLKLKGFGNDYDWHIDYEQTPGLHANSPHFISYLYNKQMYITVKFKGKFPDDCYLTGVVDDATSWKPWGDGTDLFPSVNDDDYYTGTVYNDGPWNAFLSLRKSNHVKLIDPAYVGQITPVTSTYNKTFWDEKPKRGIRVYDPRVKFEGSNETGGEGRYNVSFNKDSEGKVLETIFSIPLFTRAKELVKELGFTGNNPYWFFPRYGKVNFYVSDVNGNKKSGYDPISIDVVQVRRILNPKGVWRRSGSTEPFHVTLMHLRNNDRENYQSFGSVGPWSAEIMAGSDNVITLSTTPEGSGSQKPQHGVRRIEGANEHPIDFNINFNGSDGCAVIRVRYHNYTCEHDIFVREGYDPIDISGKGNVEWDAFNVLRFEKDGTAVMTTNPLQEGSLFRREVNIGISAQSNSRYPYEASPGNGKLSVYELGSSQYEDTRSWSELKLSTAKSDATTWKIANSNRHIATAVDYYELIASDENDINFPIDKAYGIVYGDGATETQSVMKIAEGYDDENGGDSHKGMRGVIVYNSQTKKQIFFPIGASGHGHRKHSGGWRNYDAAGTLRYASRSRLYSVSDPGTVGYVPMFEDLCERPGALYWCRDWKVGGTSALGVNSSAIDFNFFTFGLSGYGNDAAVDPWTNSHACFIRTVKEIKKK